jgi:hypothetical protein
VRQHRRCTGAAHAGNAVRGALATPRGIHGAAARLRNNFPKAPQCIPVFNTPFV